MTPSDELIAVAKTFIGTTDPSMFLKSSKLPMGSPWCAAFLQYCLEQVEEKLDVKSPVYNSALVMQIWDLTPKEFRNALPAPGRIVVWEKGGSAEGHTGIVTRVISNGRNYQTIEGNSKNPMTGVGRGVYEHIHMLSPTHPSPIRLLGFISPF